MFDVVDSEENPVSELYYGHSYCVLVRIRFFEDIERFSAGFRLETPSGIVITSKSTSLEGLFPAGRDRETVDVLFRFTSRLGSGTCILSGGVSEVIGSSFVPLDRKKGVKELTTFGKEGFGGMFDLEPEIEIRRSVTAS